MKAQPLLLLLAGSLVALAAWYVYLPNDVQADPVPEKYQGVVQKGLEYLVKNQLLDGHWEGDDGKHPVAMTALVGIALLMELDNPRPKRLGLNAVDNREAKYKAQIHKAADWLMSKAGRDGLFVSGHASETSRYMEGHGLATMFLAGLCKVERDDARRQKLSDALARAVKCIVKAQSSQGGWHHTSRVEGHDFDAFWPTVIQVQALLAAERAGIAVSSGVTADALDYLTQSVRMPVAGQRPSELSAAMRACRNQLARGLPVNLDDDDKWVERCRAEIPKGRDIRLDRDGLAHFYAAQLFSSEGDVWNEYRTAMFDRLQASQNKDGSWPAADGFGVGPVYATALWCIVLQLDHRSYPAWQPRAFEGVE